MACPALSRKPNFGAAPGPSHSRSAAGQSLPNPLKPPPKERLHSAKKHLKKIYVIICSTLKL